MYQVSEPISLDAACAFQALSMAIDQLGLSVMDRPRLRMAVLAVVTEAEHGERDPNRVCRRAIESLQASRERHATM